MARGRSSDIRRELRKVLPESRVNELARETGAVRRQRRVRIYELVWVLVLGFAIGRKRTLAALRRRYEHETGQTIEESSFYQIEDMPSSKRVVVEVLLYAAFLTMSVSRRLRALVLRRLAAMADRVPGAALGGGLRLHRP